MSSQANNDINVVLHALTGRFNDYVNPALNIGSQPAKSSSNMVTQARSLLQLHRTDTDYYVLGPYVALLASPSLFRKVASDISTIAPTSLDNIDNTTVVGATPIIDENGQPRFEHKPKSIPAASRWQVDYYTNTAVRISNDAGYSGIVDSRFSNGDLYVNWPEESGFRGGLSVVNGIWGPDVNVIINTPPRTYPYEAVRDSIRNNQTLIVLMSSNGMLEPFITAREAYQSVAALAASIVLEVNK